MHLKIQIDTTIASTSTYYINFNSFINFKLEFSKQNTTEFKNAINQNAL
jgi:hypothetical protein